MRDFPPAPLRSYTPQPQWVLLRDDRERALRQKSLEKHGASYSWYKTPLEVHDTLQVQTQVVNHPSRCDITGYVVEVKEHDHYVIRVHGSGRLTTRNMKFLKKIAPYCSEPHMHTQSPTTSPHLTPDRLDEETSA